MRNAHCFSAVALAWLAAACGGGPASMTAADLGAAGGDLRGVGADLAVAKDLGAGAPDLADSTGYPAGPYGGMVGDTLPNFTLAGYYSPTRTTGLATAEPYGSVTFEKLRKSGASHALFFLAGYS